jgi:hypothetical protein
LALIERLALTAAMLANCWARQFQIARDRTDALLAKRLSRNVSGMILCWLGSRGKS